MVPITNTFATALADATMTDPMEVVIVDSLSKLLIEEYWCLGSSRGKEQRWTNEDESDKQKGEQTNLAGRVGLFHSAGRVFCQIILVPCRANWREREHLGSSNSLYRNEGKRVKH